MWHAWGRGELFWSGGANLGDHWKDLAVGEKISLGWTLGR
jgi:hypothetical protein